MFVCVCRAVTDRQIKALTEEGVSTIKGLCLATQAGTCCGKCLPEAKKVLEESVAALASNALERVA